MIELALFVGAVLLGAVVTYLVLRARSSADGSALPAPSGEREGPDAEEILEKMGEGVFLVDTDLRPTYANSAARDMLGVQSQKLPPHLPSEEIASVARRALVDEGAEQRIHVWFPLPMTLQVRAAKLSDDGGLLVVVKDVTEESRAQKVRTEFVTHASHELKSPVASLQTLAEAIQQAVKDDPSSAERFSERMGREAERLGRLVRDLLDLSQLEESIATPAEPANLSTVARKALEQIEGDADTKEMDLVASIEDEVWVRGDEQQLGMLVQNLLENAIRYTSKFGSIRLTVALRDNEALVEVKDSGIGIPVDAHARIFERFYRVDRARSRDRGGTGLGLAIVKHVAERHGGRVELQSEVGVGSTFSAILPAIDKDAEDLDKPTGG